MISNKTYETLLNWQPVSDRIISARFSSKVGNIPIIQCYAPTELADDNEKDESIKQPDEMYRRAPTYFTRRLKFTAPAALFNQSVEEHLHNFRSPSQPNLDFNNSVQIIFS